MQYNKGIAKDFLLCYFLSIVINTNSTKMKNGEKSRLNPKFNAVAGVLIAITFIAAPLMGLALTTSFFVVGFPVFFALAAWLFFYQNRFKIVITILSSLVGLGIGVWIIFSVRLNGLLSAL